MEESKGTKAILDDREVILVECAKGFWASLGGGVFIKDNGKIKVFTKAQAKKGHEDWKAREGVRFVCAPDSMVEARIAEWRRMIERATSTQRILVNPPTEGIAKGLLEYATKPYTNVLGEVKPPMYRIPEGEEREKLVSALEYIDGLLGANNVVSALSYLCLKKFPNGTDPMLSAKLDDDYESSIALKCMNHNEMVKNAEYSTDNTWMYARIEIEKEVALVPSQF